MARKPKNAPPHSANLTPTQMRQGIERIKMRIADLEQFDPAKINRRWAHETQATEAAIDETLSRVFGHNSVEYNRYSGAASLDTGPVIMGEEDTPDEIHGYLRDGKARSLALLQQAVRGLEEELGMVAGTESPAATTGREARSITAETPVFVVHGRDGPAKIEGARLLERAGLNAIIL